MSQPQWCKNYQASSPTVSSITYDKAAWNAIKVQSNKSLVGQGSAGVIKGKGVYMANGVKNIIIQNVHFTEINPKYVWGGDAISISGADMIWIDHVKVRWTQSHRPHILHESRLTKSQRPPSLAASTLSSATLPPTVSPSPTLSSMAPPAGLPPATTT